ncbi:TetR/AcrR family transcriptional regulator [Chitinophaga parva]|nr:TetR/AcrR family transcriptional regulator [Chitinophaga parva]
MGTTERKQRQKAAVRSAILQAAWELVQADGWQSLSIRRIADAIDYSVPVIYDHFANKNDILLEFAKRGYEGMYEAVQKAKARHAAPEARLEAMAYAYCDYARANTAQYQLMFGVGMNSCEMFRQVPRLGDMEALLEQAIAAVGEQYHATLNVHVKFRCLWAMLQGVNAAYIMEDNDAHCEQQQELILSDMIHTFIKGLKP